MRKEFKIKKNAKEAIPTILGVPTDKEIEKEVSLLNNRLIELQTSGRLTSTEVKILLHIFDRIKNLAIKKTKNMVCGYLQIGINELVDGTITIAQSK